MSPDEHKELRMFHDIPDTTLARMRALSDERMDALIVPIGKGVLVCRKV